MDLSAIIFVVLALAWAVYLIPKALKHHDEMASDRLLEGHSDRVRILARKARTTAVVDADVDVAEAETAPPAEPQPTPEPAAMHDTPVAARVARSTAAKAAQRRRRVLGVLVVALVVVWTLTWFAYLPFMAPAVPGALVVAWLVIARLSVRTPKRARRARPVVESVETSTGPSGSMFEQDDPARPETTSSNADEFLDRLADEDTTGLARQELEAVLADEGSLWDPLPMTLPTYVNKARARRTVRTIELTGINSSGHDETDTALAREAAETAGAPSETETGQRKVAGA